MLVRVCRCLTRLKLFLVQPDERFVLDPEEPLAGTWEINDTPTMTGWTRDTTGMLGDVYFVVDHGDESTRFMGLCVYNDSDTGALRIVYWDLDGPDRVYQADDGGWSHVDEHLPYDPLCNKTIKILRSNWRSDDDKNCVTSWLQANATKIS